MGVPTNENVFCLYISASWNEFTDTWNGCELLIRWNWKLCHWNLPDIPIPRSYIFYAQCGGIFAFGKKKIVSTEQNVDNQTTLPFMHSYYFGKIFSWMQNFVQQAKKCRRKPATIGWLIKRPCCSAPWGQNVSTLCRTLFCIAKLVFQRGAGAVPSDFFLQWKSLYLWQIYCVTRLHLPVLL